jgi:hypothetical protein
MTVAREMVGDIFLATGLIEESALFQNGLHQNTLTLYTLLEGLGFRCHCLVEKPGAFVPGYRFLEPETYLVFMNTYRVKAYIEIGLTLDVAFRRLLQSRGTRTVKLYLGNVLNIDTETITKTPGIHFTHHVAGGLNEIWTSPHYAMNLPYLLAINGIPKGHLVPYVWDPKWIQGLRPWTPPSTWFQSDIVIMEPNISFQKSSLYPILLVKAFAKRCPEWKGRLIVQNSERLLQSKWFREQIVPTLHFPMVWKGRSPLATILLENPSATFISHQLTNDYNYLVLELMYLGYPLLHNSATWGVHGYSWSLDNWPLSLSVLRTALEHHSENENYRKQTEALTWIHSPKNPVNRLGWMALLNE